MHTQPVQDQIRHDCVDQRHANDFSYPHYYPNTLKDINHDLNAAHHEVRQITHDGYKRHKEYAQEKILALQIANPKKSPASIEKSFINAQASTKNCTEKSRPPIQSPPAEFQ